MDTCKVKLTISRAGPAGAQNRGDTVEVGPLEAGRLLRAGAIEMPDAATIKAISAAEDAAGIETAAARPAAKGKGKAKAADPAPAPAPAPEPAPAPAADQAEG